jgi:hypothetical protein
VVGLRSHSVIGNNLRTHVNSQFSVFSSVFPSPLVVVVCFMPYIRCTKFGHCQVFEMECFNKTNKIKEKIGLVLIDV